MKTKIDFMGNAKVYFLKDYVYLSKRNRGLVEFFFCDVSSQFFNLQRQPSVVDLYKEESFYLIRLFWLDRLQLN